MPPHSKEEIRALLARLDGQTAEDLESQTLDFTRYTGSFDDLVHELCRAAVCFANADGGSIVVGVKDRRQTRASAIQGVPDEMRLGGIRAGIAAGTSPPLTVDVDFLEVPEGRLLLVQVPKGFTVHSTTKGSFSIRKDRECLPLTGHDIERLLSTRRSIDLSAREIDAPWQELVSEEALALMRRLLEARASSVASMDSDAMLASLGLTRGGRLTVAGLLLVGNDDALREHLPEHEVGVIRYVSATEYDQKSRLHENLLSLLEKAEEKLRPSRRLATVRAGMQHLEFPDIPEEASREALLNALMHRDYFLPQAVLVAIRPDRIEITSPGGFPEGINPDNVLTHPPVRRNALLGEVLEKVGYVNRAGVGVDRIFEQFLREGKDFPRYESDGLQVTLRLPLRTDENFASFAAEEEKGGRKLSLQDLLILKALAGRGELDRWSGARVLQDTEEKAARHLSDLRERGFLSVMGRGAGTKYMLRKDLADRLRGDEALRDMAPDKEVVKSQVLRILKERGKLANADIRRLFGYSRMEAYFLIKELEGEGKILIRGHGRGAHIVLAD